MIWEMRADVTCPHCENETSEEFEFDLEESDQSGVNSRMHNFRCVECDRQYWAKTYMSFEVDNADSYKTKPKEK
jgi:uncharacterized protein with PIN domain